MAIVEGPFQNIRAIAGTGVSAVPAPMLRGWVPWADFDKLVLYSSVNDKDPNGTMAVTYFLPTPDDPGPEVYTVSSEVYPAVLFDYSAAGLFTNLGSYTFSGALSIGGIASSQDLLFGLDAFCWEVLPNINDSGLRHVALHYQAPSKSYQAGILNEIIPELIDFSSPTVSFGGITTAYPAKSLPVLTQDIGQNLPGVNNIQAWGYVTNLRALLSDGREFELAQAAPIYVALEYYDAAENPVSYDADVNVMPYGLELIQPSTIAAAKACVSSIGTLITKVAVRASDAVLFAGCDLVFDIVVLKDPYTYSASLGTSIFSGTISAGFEVTSFTASSPYSFSLLVNDALTCISHAAQNHSSEIPVGTTFGWPGLKPVMFNTESIDVWSWITMGTRQQVTFDWFYNIPYADGAHIGISTPSVNWDLNTVLPSVYEKPAGQTDVSWAEYVVNNPEGSPGSEFSVQPYRIVNSASFNRFGLFDADLQAGNCVYLQESHAIGLQSSMVVKVQWYVSNQVLLSDSLNGDSGVDPTYEGLQPLLSDAGSYQLVDQDTGVSVSAPFTLFVTIGPDNQYLRVTCSQFPYDFQVDGVSFLLEDGELHVDFTTKHRSTDVETRYTAKIKISIGFIDTRDIGGTTNPMIITPIAGDLVRMGKPNVYVTEPPYSVPSYVNWWGVPCVWQAI